MRFFEGRQPRFTQVPPRVRDSVMTAVLPSSAAFSAAAKAVEPEPRITRSNCSAMMGHLHLRGAALIGGPAAKPLASARHQTDEHDDDPDRRPADCGERCADAGRRDRHDEQWPGAADHDREHADDHGPYPGDRSAELLIVASAPLTY